MFGFYFAPRNWALCNGATMSIQQNSALFALLGTTFGGNGIQTFNLPDLRSRVPVHFGTGNGGGGNFVMGQTGGEENHTLLSTEMPAHSHVVSASSTVQDSASPSNCFPGGGGLAIYKPAAAGTTALLAPQAVGTAGGNASHPNLPPYLTANFCICTSGVFPSRN